MNNFFFYIDYYVIFSLLFIIFIKSINLEHYVLFKGVFLETDTRPDTEYEKKKSKVKVTKFDKSKVVYLSIKIVLIYLFIYIYALSELKNSTNLIFINKHLYILFFIFLFFLEKYSKICNIRNFEFIILLFFCQICLMLIVQCNNFLSFYVLLEIYSLSFSFVIILKNQTRKLFESSFNYLIINLIASLILLFSISYIYACTNFLTFNEINLFFSIHSFFKDNMMTFYALILFFVGLSMKLSLFPFSLYILGIYRNLSLPYVLFLLTLPKFVLILCFSYITNFIFLIFDFKIYSLFLLMLIVTALLHSYLCISSENIKSAVINISLANTPFLFTIILSKSIYITINYINFIFIYFLNLFCFFFIFFIFCLNKNFFLKNKTGMNSIFYLNIPLFSLIVINFLSLCALPPFSNFFIKLYMFNIIVEYKLFYVYLLLSFLNFFVIYFFIDLTKNLLIKSNNINLKYYKVKKCFSTYLVVFLCFFSLFYFFFFDIIYMCINNMLHLSISI